METKIEKGTLVKVKSTYKNDNLKNYGSVARDHQLPLEVYHTKLVGTEKKYYLKTNELVINNFQPNPFIMSEEDIVPITEREYNKAVKLVNKDFLIVQRERLKELRIKHIKTEDRKDYDLNSKKLLLTNTNFVRQYAQNRIEDSIEDITYNHSHWMADCCSFSKNTYDLVVYIPKTWLNYFGYNLIDLNAYMNFLSKCGVGFQGKVLSTCDLYEKYKMKAPKNFSTLTREEMNVYLKPDEIAYEVYVKASNSSMITYMYMILLRYIYNTNYWTIPFIAMKLKKKMPKISEWGCLLAAHNANTHNAYYCLANANHNSLVLEQKNRNTPEIILKGLRNAQGMNATFTLITNHNNHIDISRMIKEEKYEELQKVLLDFKNK